MPGDAKRLAAILFRYLDTGGHFLEAVIIYGHARRAARTAGDRAAEGDALTSLGVLDLRQGRLQQAAVRLEAGLALFRAADDSAGEVRAVLGHADLQQGRYDQAADCQRQSLAICRETRDRSGEASALNELGQVLLAASLRTPGPVRSRTQRDVRQRRAVRAGPRAPRARAQLPRGR